MRTITQPFLYGCACGAALSAVRAAASLGRKKKKHNSPIVPGPNNSSSRNKRVGVIETSLRYGVAAAGATGTREILLWLLRLLGADTWASVIAGGVASLWAALLPGGTARESGCLLAFSHALLAIGRRVLATDVLPRSTHYPTVIFTASCFEIMKAWFYHPHTLPKEYAEMDLRLIRGLRLLRTGEAKIGRQYDGDFFELYAGDRGLSMDLGDPQYGRIPCAVWHHPHSCTGNVWLIFRRAARAAIPLYLAVHTLPKLIFLKRSSNDPAGTLKHVLVSSFWSSAFLTTFVTSIWASVCGVRQVREIALRATGSPPHELDRWFDPIEDWGPLLGAPLTVLLIGDARTARFIYSIAAYSCALCGTSIAFEAEGRRRLLALYVVSRATMSVWQGFSLPVGENGDVVLLSGSVAMLAYCARRKKALVSAEALKMLVLAGLH